MAPCKTYFETNTEREGESGHHHGPGDGSQYPAAQPDTIVSVVSWNVQSLVSWSLDKQGHISPAPHQLHLITGDGHHDEFYWRILFQAFQAIRHCVSHTILNIYQNVEWKNVYSQLEDSNLVTYRLPLTVGTQRL